MNKYESAHPGEYQQALFREIVQDVLDGKRSEHQHSLLAKTNFLDTVRLLDLDGSSIFKGFVMNGRVKILVPEEISPTELEPIAAPVNNSEVRHGLVVLLRPTIWTQQEYFMQNYLVRESSRVFRSTRLTVERILSAA